MALWSQLCTLYSVHEHIEYTSTLIEYTSTLIEYTSTLNIHRHGHRNIDIGIMHYRQYPCVCHDNVYMCICVYGIYTYKMQNMTVCVYVYTYI